MAGDIKRTPDNSKPVVTQGDLPDCPDQEIKRKEGGSLSVGDSAMKPVGCIYVRSS